MLNPVHLRTLGAVLSSGSFAEAAAQLGYTASAVSQQMTALEKDTGLVLFERLPHGVRPTASARYLAEVGAEIVLSLTSLERNAAALCNGARGQIRVGSFATASARILPPAIVHFGATYPGVDIELEEGEPDDLMPSLLDGDLDLLVVYAEPDTILSTTEIAAAPLLDEARLLLLPPDHPLRMRGTPVHLRELRDETWVTSTSAPLLMQLCEAAGFEPRLAFSTNNFSTIEAFVRAGLGVTLLPELARDPDSSLIPMPVVPAPPHRHVHVLYRRANRNPTLPAMVEHLTKAATCVRTSMDRLAV